MSVECGFHSLIADVAILADQKVLLVRYQDANRYDHQAGWFLPDDSVRRLEHPDKAALRIASEQVGLKLSRPRLHHVESFTGNDGTWHIPFHYVARLDRVPSLKLSKEIAAAEWIELDSLPATTEVAHHGWALSTLGRILKD